MAHRQAVRLGYLIDMISSDEMTRSRHVFDGNRWLARNMLSQMPGHGPRIEIVSSTSRGGDDDSNHFIFIKWLLRKDWNPVEKTQAYDEGYNTRQPFRHTAAPFVRNLS